MNTKKHYPTSDLNKLHFAFGRAYNGCPNKQWFITRTLHHYSDWIGCAPRVNLTHLWTVWPAVQKVTPDRTHYRIASERAEYGGIFTGKQPIIFKQNKWYASITWEERASVECAAPIGFI